MARKAEGGMRDALSLLDQVRAAAGETPGEAAVAEALGAVDAAAVSRIAGALIGRDGARIVSELEALHARGLEMKRVAEEIARHLRNVVVARLVPDAPFDLADTELAEVRAQAALADPAQLTRLFDLCQKAVAEVKTSEQPRYALEVALLAGAFLAPGADIGVLLARAEALAGGALAGGAAGRSRSPTGTGGTGPGSSRTVAPPPEARPPSPPPAQGEAPAPPPAGAEDARWRVAVEAVERESSMAASALKQAVVLGLREGEVALQIPPGMFAATVEKRRAEIEAAFGRFFGRPTRLALSIGAPVPASAGEPAPPAAPSLAAAEAAERLARSARVRETARAHPSIREAVRVLDAKIDRIDEL